MPHFSKEDKEKIEYLKKIVYELLSKNHEISKSELISVFEEKGWDKLIIKEVFHDFDKKQKKLIQKDKIEQRKREKEEKRQLKKQKKESNNKSNDNNSQKLNDENQDQSLEKTDKKKQKKEEKKRLKEEKRIQKEKLKEEKRQQRLEKIEQKRQEKEGKNKIKIQKKDELNNKPSKISIFLNLFNKEVEETKNHESIILLIITVLGYGFALNQSIFFNSMGFIKNEAIRKYVVAPYLFVIILILGFVLIIETLRKLFQK